MRSFFGLFGLVFVIFVTYLAVWPVPVQPKAWDAPPNPGYAGDFAPNNRLSDLEFLDLDGRHGPEDVAIGPDGLIYVATHGGEIIRRSTDPDDIAEVFAITGGRPLGIEFAQDGTLYVADAYRGLLSIDAKGAVRVLATEAEGRPIVYANDLDIAQDGTIYFTDASTRFGAEANGGTLSASVLDLVEHSNNGRVLKYDPRSGQTTLFTNGMTFPNGVAIGADGSVFVVETGAYRVWRLSQDGTQREVVLENLPGFPDNINNAPDGTLWLGLVSPRNDLMDKLDQSPEIRRAVLRLPEKMKPAPTRYGFILRMRTDGKVVETLQDPAGAYALTTGAVSTADGQVIVASLTERRLGVLRH
ncbi:MAG: SMP-30/gluconolactonase/LRE family protein [Thalassovita sp.]